MDPPIQQYRGVLPVAHAERLGSGQAGTHNLARRRPPRPRMSLAPAECPPIGSGIERRPAIMPDACCGEKNASIVVWHHPDKSAGRSSPMPDLVVCVTQFGDRSAADGLNAGNHIAGV